MNERSIVDLANEIMSTLGKSKFKKGDHAIHTKYGHVLITEDQDDSNYFIDCVFFLNGKEIKGCKLPIIFLKKVSKND